MPSEHKTFSEVWYRVADQKVWLAPQVRVRRQLFRGQSWYLVEDPFNNSFHRMQPQAYAFVGRLRKDRTVQEVWRECLEIDPENAPGQEEVIQLLAQLHQANLLHGDVPPDHARIFERYRKRKQKERQFIWRHLMFARFPLWDPDSFLQRTLPVVRLLVRPWALVVWVVVVVWAIKAVLENSAGLGHQAMSLLAFENLLLLYAAIVLVKTLHEFGHAYACRLLGGEVHTMGLMLLVLSPLPYMDATASWAFRERWKRVAVASAGMMVEFFVAACAALFWVAASEGAWRDLAFNVMVVASVSTLIFNVNPLLRYDGYYILADLVDVPNLHTRGQKQIRHLAERYLFGLKKTKSPAHSGVEAFWLTTHGILAGIYRFVVFAGILFFVGTQYLLLGILIGVVCLISWVVVPLGRFLKFLVASPSLQRNRTRAVAVTLSLGAAVFLLVGALPFPQSLRAPGVLRSVAFQEVVSESGGFLSEWLVSGGIFVESGTPLLRLSDPSIQFELDLVNARLREIEVMWRKSLGEGSADVAALETARVSLLERQSRLQERMDNLVVRAPESGLWTHAESRDLFGAWMPRGTRAGYILPDRGFQFSGIVPQRAASRLFTGEATGATVKLKGQAGVGLLVTELLVIQAEQARLPSAALGVLGGGTVLVSGTDQEGIQASESFFEVRALIDVHPHVLPQHGMTGIIRFQLPPEPLLRQADRRLRQLFQSHFQL